MPDLDDIYFLVWWTFDTSFSVFNIVFFPFNIFRTKFQHFQSFNGSVNVRRKHGFLNLFLSTIHWVLYNKTFDVPAVFSVLTFSLRNNLSAARVFFFFFFFIFFTSLFLYVHLWLSKAKNKSSRAWVARHYATMVKKKILFLPDIISPFDRPLTLISCF